MSLEVGVEIGKLNLLIYDPLCTVHPIIFLFAIIKQKHEVLLCDWLIISYSPTSIKWGKISTNVLQTTNTIDIWIQEIESCRLRFNIG